MFEELTLILAVSRDRLGGQHMKPIPNAIELPETAAQFLRNFDPRIKNRLWPATPPASELMEIFSVGAIAANRQPIALTESRKQTKVRRTQSEPQFALPLQPACQHKPFIYQEVGGSHREVSM